MKHIAPYADATKRKIFSGNFVMAKDMFSLLLYGLIFAVIYESQNACGMTCNTPEIDECIEKFHLFEDKAFPVYGKDENELNDVCLDLESTLQCPLQFSSCEGDDACDDDCKASLNVVNTFNERSSLNRFHEALCAGVNPFRTKYLDHANCLYNVSEESHSYEECYNTSMASMQFLFSNPQHVTLETKCCYFTWLRGCYMKVTSDSCGADAANFVSEALNFLKPRVGEECRSEATCEIPPLRDSPRGKKNDDLPPVSESSLAPVSESSVAPVSESSVAPVSESSVAPVSESTKPNATGSGQRVLFNHVLAPFMIVSFMLTFLK